MKRVVFICSLILIFSLGQTLVCHTFGAAPGQSKSGKTCHFSIVGMWKIEGRTETDSLFYSFSTEGWVRIVSHSSDALPREYENSRGEV
jgi:hypothetical protein